MRWYAYYTPSRIIHQAVLYTDELNTDELYTKAYYTPNMLQKQTAHKFSWLSDYDDCDDWHKIPKSPLRLAQYFLDIFGF